MLSSLTVVLISGSEDDSGRAMDVTGKADVSPGEVGNVLVATSRVVIGTVMAISTGKDVCAPGADVTMGDVCNGNVTSPVLVVNSVVSVSLRNAISSLKTADVDIVVSLRDTGSVPSIEDGSSAVIYAGVGSVGVASDSSDSSVSAKRTPHI